jgi:hypothetical protein
MEEDAGRCAELPESGYQEVGDGVVFEAGFSEPYSDFQRDAVQWLLKMKGRVRLVVLFVVEEDKPAVARRRKEREQDIRILVQKWGNSVLRQDKD